MSQVLVEDDTWAVTKPSIKDYIELNVLMAKFNKKLGGCRSELLGNPSDVSCNPSLGQFDYGLWSQIKRKGREVFKEIE